MPRFGQGGGFLLTSFFMELIERTACGAEFDSNVFLFDRLRAGCACAACNHSCSRRRPAAWSMGIRGCPCNNRAGDRSRYGALDHERLGRQGVLVRRKVNTPEYRERSHSDRRGGESPRRHELDPLAIHGLRDADRLQLPVATAATGQSEQSWKQEDYQNAVSDHGTSPAPILTPDRLIIISISCAAANSIYETSLAQVCAISLPPDPEPSN